MYKHARKGERVLFFPFFFDDFSERRPGSRNPRGYLGCAHGHLHRGRALPAAEEALLPDLGDRVVGLNGTPCFEALEKKKSKYINTGPSQDVQLKTIIDRVSHYCQALHSHIALSQPAHHAMTIVRLQCARLAPLPLRRLSP